MKKTRKSPLKITASAVMMLLLHTPLAASASTIDVGDSLTAAFARSPSGLTGTRTLLKTGTGTLVVPESFHSTAPMTITAGTLELSSISSVVLSGAVTINNGATLSIDSNISVYNSTVNNPSVFAGGLTMAPGSTLNLGDGVNFAQDITIGSST